MRRAMLWVLLSGAALSAGADLFPGSRPARVRLARAETVALGYLTADGFIAAAHGNGVLDVLPADREALGALRARIEAWGRYRVVDHPLLADVRVGVRTGRRATVGFSKPIAGHERAQSVRGHSLSVRIFSGEDALAVLEAEADGGELLWESYRRGGLGESQPLFEELVAAVESMPRR